MAVRFHSSVAAEVVDWDREGSAEGADPAEVLIGPRVLLGPQEMKIKTGTANHLAIGKDVGNLAGRIVGRAGRIVGPGDRHVLLRRGPAKSFHHLSSVLWN